jgi:ketosteroid isomerase-like protein
MELHEAEAFAKRWIQDWNGRDLEALLSHYTEDVEFQSPLAIRILGEASGVVRGRTRLREYFQKALAAFPGDLGLELLAVHRGVQSLVVHFQAPAGSGAELMELTPEGKVRRALAHVRPRS